MATNRGKEFEVRFKQDFKKIPNSSIDRLYDPTAGFKGIKNICDFIGYVFPYIYYMETKSIKGNTFPFTKLTQYEKLLEKKDIYGSISGAIIWFIEHRKICWVGIEEFERLKNLGYKSINIKMLNDPNYSVVEIPTKTLRVNLEADYTKLIEIARKKWQNH